MKYIDSDKLIAEIERRLKIVEPYKDTFESAAACRQELIWMKEFITSLQQEQPEVGLEKEIDKEWAKCEPMDEGMGLESANIVNEQFDSIARHFYELGQRTKYQQDREEFAKLKVKEWQSGYDEGYAKGLNTRKEE